MTKYSNNLRIYSLESERNKNISPHFKVKEFACKDGNNYVIVNPDLVGMLEHVHARMNAKAINIVSGYRTESHSFKIGSKGPNDNHALGCAVDFYVKKQNGKKATSEEIKNVLVDLGFKGGIGIINGTNVHIDSGVRSKNPYIFKE